MAFGTPRGKAVLGVNPAVAADSHGRLYAAGFGIDGIQVFDSSGMWIRTLGGKGRDLGSYDHISALFVTLGDTVRLFDGARARFTVLDPNYKVVRTGPVTFDVRMTQSIVLRDGRLVFSGDVPTRADVGQPLHLADVNMRIVKSWGDLSLPYLGKPTTLMRKLTEQVDGTIVASALKSYDLDEWKSDGTHLASFRRRPIWFPLPDSNVSRTDRPPSPFIAGIQADSGRLVWVLITVPDAHWKAPKARSTSAESEVIDEQNLDDQFDTFVELLDLKRGRVVASQRFPQYFNSFVRSRELLHRDSSPNDPAMVSIWSIRLRRGQS